MKAQHQSYTWRASGSFHVKGVGSDSWKSRKGWEWLGRLWRLHASWAWVTIRKWGGRVRRRKLRSIWYLSQPGSWHSWTAWAMRPWCQKKGPEKLRIRFSFCIETQGLAKALWKSERMLWLIPVLVPEGENVLPMMKICAQRGPDHGCFPWERKNTRSSYQGHSPPAAHLIDPFTATVSALLAILSRSTDPLPQGYELLEHRNYFLSVSLRSWTESAVQGCLLNGLFLAERPVVMTIVKMKCLQDSHLYWKCHMKRGKEGGQKGSPKVHLGWWSLPHLLQ